MRRIHALTLFALLTSASPTIADPLWIEVGDAGDVPSTAQVAGGVGPLPAISGTIEHFFDVDLYLIFITGGGTFSATTVGLTDLDTQLFLFAANGFGVYANDDAMGTFQSTLPAGHPLTPTSPGLYFLAVSSFDRDPTSFGGPMFPSFPPDAVTGPTGPGGGQPIFFWTETGFTTGSYTVALTGAEFVIPEPATMTLVTTGMLALLARGRKHQRPGRFRNFCRSCTRSCGV